MADSWTPTNADIRARYLHVSGENGADFDRWLAEHDRKVRAPLEELIEEAREALGSSSVPLGLSEAEFYRILASTVRGILSRQVPDDVATGGAS